MGEKMAKLKISALVLVAIHPKQAEDNSSSCIFPMNTHKNSTLKKMEAKQMSQPLTHRGPSWKVWPSFKKKKLKIVGWFSSQAQLRKRFPPHVFREQGEDEPAAAAGNSGSPEASNTGAALPGKRFVRSTALKRASATADQHDRWLLVHRLKARSRLLKAGRTKLI